MQMAATTSDRPTPRAWDRQRPYEVLAQPADWDWCTLRDVALDPASGVALRRLDPGDPGDAAHGLRHPSGLDRSCRLHLGREGDGYPIDRVSRPLEAGADQRFTMELMAAGELRAIVADANDRLYVLDDAGRQIRILDLWQGRIVATVMLDSPAQPTRRGLDLAAVDGDVWVLLDEAAPGRPAIARLVDLAVLVHAALPADSSPRRLAIDPTRRRCVIVGSFTLDGTLVDGIHVAPLASIARAGRVTSLDVVGATDAEFESTDQIVVARGPGADLIEVHAVGDRWVRSGLRRGDGYAGGDLVLLGDRVAAWDGTRLRRIPRAPDRYATSGFLITARLDAGVFANQWGRIFLDACIPADTGVRVACFTSDDPDADAAAELHSIVGAREAEPPSTVGRLTRRTEGRELAWDPIDPSTPLQTYEAPVLAGPARYLWLHVAFTGQSLRSPQIAEIRVERHRNRLADKLPAVFTNEPVRADFLGRYLSIVDGTLHELESRAALRELLFDPDTTPTEALDWLSSIVGLTHDLRWSEQSRRQLLDEIVELFRRRGTIGSLRRMMELYLDVPVTILEHFRLRGVAGQLLGDGDPGSSSILGGGFRVGGSFGDPGAGDASSGADRFAHRFTVLVPILLDDEQRSCIDHLLEVHRPAHTVVEVCALDAGMRVGRGLHLGLSSMVGHTGSFNSAVVGDAIVGRGSLVGRPSGVAPVGGRVVGIGRAG